MANTKSISLTLPELRVLAKSVAKSLDAEARKIERTMPETPMRKQAEQEWALLDGIQNEVATAMSDLIAGAA